MSPLYLTMTSAGFCPWSLPHPEPERSSVLYLPTGSTAADPPAFSDSMADHSFSAEAFLIFMPGTSDGACFFATFFPTCKMKGTLETPNLLFVKSFENFTCQLNSVIKIGISFESVMYVHSEPEPDNDNRNRFSVRCIAAPLVAPALRTASRTGIPSFSAKSNAYL